MEWQDIETAPSDGTQVLLWSPTWRHPFVGHRSHRPYMAYIDVPTPIATEIEVFCAYWMPLPGLPEKESANAKG